MFVPHRRRREKKTDYKLRLALLKSGKPRLVIRKSLKHITAQIIIYERDGDKTLISACSKELEKLGWKHNTGNFPAAYLTGLSLGKRAKEKKIKEAILDIGLQESTKGNRIYALLKGVLETGINISHSEGILPEDD